MGLRARDPSIRRARIEALGAGLPFLRVHLPLAPLHLAAYLTVKQCVVIQSAMLKWCLAQSPRIVAANLCA
jgi:hypothetical protein